MLTTRVSSSIRPWRSEEEVEEEATIVPSGFLPSRDEEEADGVRVPYEAGLEGIECRLLDMNCVPVTGCLWLSKLLSIIMESPVAIPLVWRGSVFQLPFQVDSARRSPFLRRGEVIEECGRLCVAARRIQGV